MDETKGSEGGPEARVSSTDTEPYPAGMLVFMDARCPTPQAHGNADPTEARDCAPCFADYHRILREAIMDEFGILYGEAADQILALVANPEPPSPEKRAFMDECTAIYKRSQPATCQRCDAACSVCRSWNAP